jgi:hypothetical protein
MIHCVWELYAEWSRHAGEYSLPMWQCKTRASGRNTQEGELRVFDGSTHHAVTDPQIRSNRPHGVGTCQRCIRHTAVINFVLAQGDEDAAAFPGRNVSAGRQYFA